MDGWGMLLCSQAENAVHTTTTHCLFIPLDQIVPLSENKCVCFYDGLHISRLYKALQSS